LYHQRRAGRWATPAYPSTLNRRWEASIPFHGVLAPNTRLRPAIVPSPPVNATNTAKVHRNSAHYCAPARISWARLLKRVFAIDMEHCPHCGGTLKIIAAIEAPAVIAKILAHLGLSARAPPRSTARPFENEHPIRFRYP
ncbi:MAG: hypothetical protein ACREX4_19960, partial [Gammaproteobacteria bacterium]